MDALQEVQNWSQASIRTTLPRAPARLIGAPLTHEEGSSEPNSGAIGPGALLGEQAARAATKGKIERRSMVVLFRRPAPHLAARRPGVPPGPRRPAPRRRRWPDLRRRG